MLERARRIAVLVVLLCLAALLIAATLLALQMREAAADAATRVDAVAAHALMVEDAAAQQLNALQAGKLAHDARLSLDNLNRAAIDERMYFEQQVPPTMGRVNGVLDGLKDDAAGLRESEAAATLTLDAASEELRGLQPIERTAAQTLQDADAVIANPQIPLLLQHAEQAAAAGASAAQHLDGTAGDVQGAVHGYLHPGWKTQAADWAARVVHALGGWF